MDDLTTPGEHVGEQPVLVRPVPHLRSPILDEPSRRPPSRDGRDPVPVPEAVRALVPYLLLVGLVGVAFFFAAGGDWAQVAAGTTVAAIAMRSVANRITFTFAEGFLAYRARNDWPRGVQEEYDVHYAWPSSGRFSAGR